MKICGIYKITSPSNKIYIGQSVDVLGRWKSHRDSRNSKKSKLSSSFIKYGSEKHKFEIVCQCDERELNNLEKYYVDLFQTFNSEYGLNLKDGGGSHGRHSEETKLKISLIQKGVKRKPHSEETKKKIGASSKITQKGKRHSEETKRKMSVSHIGINTWMKDRIITDETRKKLSESLRLAHKEGRMVLKHSLEAREKMSKSRKGKISWNKGLPWSDEAKNKMRLAKLGKKRPDISARQMGRKISEETKRKMSISMKKYFLTAKQ